jgi:predicted nuclease with TOPRIM domain
MAANREIEAKLEEGRVEREGLAAKARELSAELEESKGKIKTLKRDKKAQEKCKESMAAEFESK